MIKFKQIFKIKCLAIACIFQLLESTASVADDFDLDNVNLTQHAIHYNSLPSPQKSNSLLESSKQFETFFEQAKEVAIRHKVEDSVGLRLIHKHFTLEEGQLMTENYEASAVPSLVTESHTLKEAKAKGAVPASWIFTDNPIDGGVLFEASSDSAVKSTVMKLQQDPEFFTEMAGLLRQYNLNNILSIAVLKRDTLIASGDEMYMEDSYLSTERSVVRLWDNNENPLEKYVRTSWDFMNPIMHGCSYVWICSPWLGCYMTGSHDSDNTNTEQSSLN